MGMSKIWYNRINAGTRVLAKVPAPWKDQVIELIENAYFNNEISKADYNRMMGIEEEVEIDEDSLIDEYTN